MRLGLRPCRIMRYCTCGALKPNRSCSPQPSRCKHRPSRSSALKLALSSLAAAAWQVSLRLHFLRLTHSGGSWSPRCAHLCMCTIGIVFEARASEGLVEIVMSCRQPPRDRLWPQELRVQVAPAVTASTDAQPCACGLMHTVRAQQSADRVSAQRNLMPTPRARQTRSAPQRASLKSWRMMHPSVAVKWRSRH